MAQRRTLEADAEQIGIARSTLLPQVGFGARGQYIDDERADSARGNNKTGSFLVAAGLSQTIYDEGSWAAYTIQKHVYEGQVEQLRASELDVVRDAADAFLGLDAALNELRIQRGNREITVQNLERSRARIAAGWSGERESLRWRAQLASNDTAVRAAEVRVLQNLFELNRVRNRAPESKTDIVPATIDTLGFLYADPEIASAIEDPDRDRRMRDVLVRAGLARSPQLAAFDDSIAAGERQLTADRRAFWVPTVTFEAGVDYLANHDNQDDDFNQTEWGVVGLLEFPIFEGGAKFASLDQARAQVASLRTQRSATAQALEQAIRASFAQATGSFETVGYSQRQVEAARENFDLVTQSYTLGVASILDLLDAQTQLLSAELALNSAIFGFLGDLVAAEQATSFFAFIEPPDAVEALSDQIAREIGVPR